MLPISEINDLTMNLLRLDDESPFFFLSQILVFMQYVRAMVLHRPQETMNSEVLLKTRFFFWFQM